MGCHVYGSLTPSFIGGLRLLNVLNDINLPYWESGSGKPNLAGWWAGLLEAPHRLTFMSFKISLTI